MISERFITLTCLLCSLALVVNGSADDLLFEDGGKLSGKVTHLTADGHLLLNSPLSKAPLDLRAEHVQRITFAPGARVADDHDSMVTLVNGDQFPCDLKTIDAASVSVDTSFAGPLTIPRSAMRTLQLGVRPRKTIYDGPKDAEGWDIKSGWKYDSDSFVANSGGVISRKFEVPQNHYIHFNVSWTSIPNLQVGFDDDVLDPGSRADRYILNINGGGLDLKREQKEGRRFLPMANIPRDFSGMPEQSVSFELRIDRKLSVVSLYLDGKYEGRWADPSPTGKAPAGNGIFFRGNVSSDETMTLDEIRLGEWDASSDRHRSEERGNASKDSIILRDGDRGEANIISYQPTTGGEGMLTYKMAHREEPLETPSTEISTLFFAESGGNSKVKTPVSLTLQGRGSLSTGAVSFEEGAIRCDHPLLGQLSLRNESVTRMDRRRAPGKKDAPAEDTEDDNPGDPR